MRIYHNGTLAFDETTGDLFDDGQLSQISLSMSAIDFEIGQGTLAVPGNPGWVAGDRITIYEQGTTIPGGDNVTSGGVDVTSGGVQVISTPSSTAPTTSDYLIYTGFVAGHSRIRNPYAPLEFTSIYQLMDPNRQGIGRAVANYYVAGNPGPPPMTSANIILDFITTFMTDVDLDMTYFSTNTTPMLAATYNGDGIMDVLATVILYTGWTAFMTVTDVENQYAFHFHLLTDGPNAGLSIDDTPFAADGTTVFAPRSPEYHADPSDLKNYIQANNGLTTIVDSNTTSQALYGAGGLHWETVVTYGVDEQSLISYVSSTMAAAFEVITYACTIGPLDGYQVSLIRPGSLIPTISQVFGLVGDEQRISRITLTPAQGDLVAPGLWDAHLELSRPYRLPSQALNVGGQGGYSGQLTDPFNIIEIYKPISGGTFVASDIPVGATYRIDYQQYGKDGALNIPGDSVFFTLEMWADVAETVPGDGWSINTPLNGDTSDTNGRVFVDLTHDTAGTSVVVNVICSR